MRTVKQLEIEPIIGLITFAKGPIRNLRYEVRMYITKEFVEPLPEFGVSVDGGFRATSIVNSVEYSRATELVVNGVLDHTKLVIDRFPDGPTWGVEKLDF